MTTPATDTQFCSVCARQAGLDPAGYGGADFATIIAAELALPWPQTLFSDPERLPAEILEVMQHIRDEYARTHRVDIRMLGVAPDQEYSVSGMRRVICWRRPNAPFAQFSRSEYLVPEAQAGPLVATLALDPARAGEFQSFQQPAADVRDLLVCTHGSVDAACSKFGYPTYAYLRQLAAASNGTLRAWRTTHFGGHVFAPTLIDLPHGSFWAYIDRAEAELLAARAGDTARLRDHYRGWCGLPTPFLQVLERELFVRWGWDWLGYAKTGCVLAQDEPAAVDGEDQPAPHWWAEVQIDYRAPDGTPGSTRARVELSRHIETIANTGNPQTYAYAQYSIAWLRDERGIEHETA